MLSISIVLPRYSTRPLPETPYLPGVSPRSARPAPGPEPASVDVDALASSDDLRHGIDLFNRGFPWEAHEAWEPLWFALPRERPERALVQGLIHLAAAAVKVRTGAETTAREFLASACEYLMVASGTNCFDVPPLVGAVHAWALDLSSTPPTLTLASRAA